MAADDLFTRLVASVVLAPGRRVALDCGEAGAMMLDGVTQTVTRGAEGADATIAMSMQDLSDLASGALDPDDAFVAGRMKITGDLGAALAVAHGLAHQDAGP